jgi:uncharacterized membrane protein
MIKKISIGILILLVAIQFVPYEKNLSNDKQYDLAKSYNVPDNVQTILKGACNDCHTNQSTYPWYASIEPVGYWLNHHIEDGKKHLNFSNFTNLPLRVQNHKFEEIVEMVEEKEMPLESYTYFGLHPEANLTDEERKTLVNWAKDQMAMLAATHPADSIKMKPKPTNP